MNQYNNLNVKLSNSEINKLIIIINGTEVTLNLSSNVTDSFTEKSLLFIIN